MNVREFAMIEVWRQGFFPETREYADRVDWMVGAFEWAKAHAENLGLLNVEEKPTIDDMFFIAARVEPTMNLQGYRHMDLQFPFDAAHWRDIPTMIARLWQFIDDATPEEFYKQFEEIHPFEDGNGRTGKIIYNWLKGTLENPVFPPDFFGKGEGGAV